MKPSTDLQGPRAFMEVSIFVVGSKAGSMGMEMCIWCGGQDKDPLFAVGMSGQGMGLGLAEQLD